MTHIQSSAQTKMKRIIQEALKRRGLFQTCMAEDKNLGGHLRFCLPYMVIEDKNKILQSYTKMQLNSFPSSFSVPEDRHCFL